MEFARSGSHNRPTLLQVARLSKTYLPCRDDADLSVQADTGQYLLFVPLRDIFPSILVRHHVRLRPKAKFGESVTDPVFRQLIFE